MLAGRLAGSKTIATASNGTIGTSRRLTPTVPASTPLPIARRSSASRSRCIADREAREAEDEKRQEEAAAECVDLWRNAQQCGPGDHPYLVKKNLKDPHGARISGDELIIPVFDATDDETLITVQRILSNGVKLFWQEARARGGSFVIGGPLSQNKTVIIVEGFSKGARIYELMTDPDTVSDVADFACVVAFGCGNLPAVAEAIRKRFPAAEMLVASDDNWKTQGNPGLAKAREAAALARAHLAIPVFQADRKQPDAPEMIDFDDLADVEGEDAVRDQINAALAAAVVDPVANDDWPEPVDCFTPFSTAPDDVVEDDIPPALWPFVDDTAERMGVARSTVALACLVTCSSIADDEFHLQPKQYDDTWTEQARIWGAIVGDPSIKKTPVIQAATRPIDHLERDARNQWQDEVKKWETAQKNAAASGFDFDDPQPRRPRHLVESATVEALQEVLRDDKDAKFTTPAHKVLVRQDELSEFLANLDRYSTSARGGDRGAYLRLYNGGSYSVDRIGRGSFTSAHWSGCILGGIQPKPIQAVAKHAVDDGLLQRFCFDVPPQAQDGQDRPPDRAAIERYYRLIPALAKLHPHRRDLIVTLAPDAQAHRQDVDIVGRGLAATMPDMSPRLKSALGKWDGLFARLCLLFHLIEIADARASHSTAVPPINVVSAATAERVSRYMRRILLPHLLRAEEVIFATTQTGHAKWIAGHILANNLDRISVRDVTRAYRALGAPEQRRELESVMQSLVSVGWIDPEPPKNPLNPILTWRVNPNAHILFADRAERERQEREQRQQETIRRRAAWKAAAQ